MGLLLLFVDGVGVGSRKHNPLCTQKRQVLSFSQESLSDYKSFGAATKSLDACLGVEGFPQSATGQTTIFTGINAAAEIGKHLSGMPNKELRKLLRKQSIFLSLTRAGKKCTFVNGFTPAYFLMPHSKMSASTMHMLYAGMKPNWVWDSAHSRSLYYDFTNKSLVEAGFHVPMLTPESAGETLAGITAENDFALYEYFLTDTAGHKRLRRSTPQIVDELDRMITRLLTALDLEEHAVLLCSDHGNLEDDTTKTHTRNPVPLIAWGAGSIELVENAESLTDIYPATLKYFGVK